MIRQFIWSAAVGAVLSTALMASNAPATSATATPPQTGGWAQASVGQKDVLAAAHFAVSAQAKKLHRKIGLRRVVDAQQQVVSGMNYKMTLIVSINGRLQRVEAQVYAPLSGDKELTSWTAPKP